MNTKTYATENLYSIQEVSVVFATLRTRSEKKKDYQSTRNATTTKKSFAEVLEESKEKEQSRNIHVYTSGYTKDALPFHNYISQREYV